ncbi:sec7 guanine nucleotide exchange factor [Moniliophthora roreri MCA 2997]|uniref:Sec7 guanine nucleotide exchange factor n=1 Tax=Moniliophthora roreri (strain MCA 2997) TaxID=1381753 RepID=V2XYK5_MONRO|nr:sec7 guanine nucleotide exchange factor [Moniliophthora roreri MCA 2997]KAI3612579.1 sec7 guanine nucleotide exchange factor [Moniliophthora roreri]
MNDQSPPTQIPLSMSPPIENPPELSSRERVPPNNDDESPNPAPLPESHTQSLETEEKAAETSPGHAEAALPVQPESDARSEPPLPPTPPTEPNKRDSASQVNPQDVQIRPVERNSHLPDLPPSPSPRVGSPLSATHRRSLTIGGGGNSVSVVLISSALETIAASKEAKRSTTLRENTQHALELIRSDQGGNHPRDIFEPLRLACETKNEKLMIASLDCISKLISYSFFVEPPSAHHNYSSPPASPGPAGRTPPEHPSSLVDLVTNTIAACHSEVTPEAVSLQIVKALLSLVLSPTVLVHHSSLLKAVRTVYNVFLLSADPVNQMVAQGGLTQMVHHVFTRCRVGSSTKAPGTPGAASLRSPSQESFPSSKFTSFSLATDPTTPTTSNEPTLDSEKATDPSASTASLHLPAENSGSSVVESEEAKSAFLHDEGRGRSSSDIPNDVHELPLEANGHRTLTTNDLFIKDAFLVFRALCKLTMKPLNNESERDMKSHAMRSKLLSLHLVLTVLNSHMPLLVDPSAIIYSNSSNEATTFVQAINQYLCLTLSRNAVSPVLQVFEISVEIFWRVLAGMRTKLKKEIEVLLHEIFIPILEMRTSTLKQKAVILGMLSRLCQDPQALVEIYLNYDCDSESADNIYEHLMNIISKIGTIPSAAAPKANEPASPAVAPTTKNSSNNAVPPSLSTAAMSVSGSMDTSSMGQSEAHLRRQGLECLVTVLRSLVAWGTTAGKTADDNTLVASSSTPSQVGEDIRRSTLTPDPSLDKVSSDPSTETLRQPTPDIMDDPSKFESAKQKKTTLLEGIKKFNFKPKRGVQFFIETGFIPSSSPQDIARFLLNTDGLSKAAIGEYLGEGEEENIAIMHAFVDMLDFNNLPFVEALRVFLQAFRLPGEAQKIDRYMLKFAERYIDGNSQTVFANADAAYVLAYSVILLNTDAHNPQVKKRMTKADFIKNNRGINDNSDLPEELLSEIYDDIVSNEIKMKDEVGPTASATGPSLASALANMGRDLQKEAYVMQSSGMANKTEALFRTMMRTQRKGSKGGEQFFSASHFVHVRPMFEVAWIPFLAGLSGPLQDTDDLEIVELCLDGFKSAIRIVCFFDLELERNAFVTTLAKFTFLNNLGEMKTKNMEAIKTLLDVAVTEGNNLKGSWHEVLTCVSQLEHMQLISGGVDIPDSKKGRMKKLPNEELANESRSTHITVAADMVFSLSHYLSGTAIVDFVQALSDVSWEEIQSSGLSQHPRLFSLQKLVEISYYNMNRIRLEWSNLWDILGEHFNQVCCHNNPHVASFALDSLRQLAMRFLEKEELTHFKFQKDFLKPFEHTMIHNSNPDIRDMVLQCLQQMIQARVQNMRSGWRTMFGVFQAASKVLTERIANSGFEIVTRLNKDHFDAIVRHGAFADLTVCITDFCKVSKYQKVSLLAIGMLRGVIPVMLECPECGWSTESMDDNMIKYWYPVLFAFYDIIMNGEDLEVRRLALDSLFTTLKTYGKSYPIEFWDTVCQELLFPIFSVLKSSQDLSRFSTQEDMSVWLSTTMIQALRDLIDLYTFFFDILERFLDGLLDLLCVCICQENDTLARIGTSCLQQLLENNVSKLSSSRWERVATTFVRLFKTTTPHQLFDDELRVQIGDQNSAELSDANDANGQAILPAPLSSGSEQVKGSQHTVSDRRRIFKQIIVKCVLQLLLIETTNDLLRNDEVYNNIPPDQLLRLMGVLDHSYQFARMFNEDKDLRTGLWKVGFMKHLPNLLKQESSSASTLVHVLLRMYYDPRPEHQTARGQIAERLMPLSLGVIRDFNKLRADTQAKNIVAWTPVVAEILDGFCRFNDKAFVRYLPAIYPLVAELLARELTTEVRQSLKTYFVRVGFAQGIIESS